MESEGAAHEPLFRFFVLPALLLQRTNDQPQAKQQKANLHRRMALWREGNIGELLSEGRCLQDNPAGRGRGRGRPRSSQPHDEARTFRDLVGHGHIHQAIRSLSDNPERGGSLRMEDVVQVSDEPRSVHDILREKHPHAQPAAQEALLEGEAGSINPVIFDSLTAALIRQTALHANGSAGPSGLDSHAWRRICSRYRKASDDICTQLAALGRGGCSPLIQLTQ